MGHSWTKSGQGFQSQLGKNKTSGLSGRSIHWKTTQFRMVQKCLTVYGFKKGSCRVGPLLPMACTLKRALPPMEPETSEPSAWCGRLICGLQFYCLCPQECIYVSATLVEVKILPSLGNVQKVAGWVRCACSPKWGKCARTLCFLHKLGLLKPGGLPRCI